MKVYLNKLLNMIEEPDNSMAWFSGFCFLAASALVGTLIQIEPGWPAYGFGFAIALLLAIFLLGQFIARRTETKLEC